MDGQYTGQKKKRTKNDIQHLKQQTKVDQHEPDPKAGVYPCAPEGKICPALIVAPVVLLLTQTSQ